MLTDLCFKCSNKDSILCTTCGIAKDGAREHFKQKPLTNGERIRAMTDEELADMLVDIGECDRRCPAKLGDCIFSDSSCRSAWLDWLKQEAS